MARFLPAFFQERILRYVLARCDIFEEDALALENLGITWGQENIVRLKNVRLKANRLCTLLGQSELLVVEKATIDTLYLNIPADIFRKGVVIEVAGLAVRTRLKEPLPSKRRDARNDSPSEAAGMPKWQADRRPRSPRPGVHDPGGAPLDEESVNVLDAGDLAQSFIVHESDYNKARLRNLVEQSQKLQASQSSLSTSSEDSSEPGIGEGLSLPGFVASFLRGIVDRIKVTVRNVRCHVLFSDSHLQDQDRFTDRGEKDILGVLVKLDEIEYLTIQEAAANMHENLKDDSSTTNRRLKIGPINAALVVPRDSLDTSLSVGKEDLSVSLAHTETRLAGSHAEDDLLTRSITPSQLSHLLQDSILEERSDIDPVETIEDDNESAWATESRYSTNSRLQSVMAQERSTYSETPDNFASFMENDETGDELQDSHGDEHYRSTTPTQQDFRGQNSIYGSFIQPTTQAEDDTVPDTTETQDDLTASMVYSHDEASSLYQSAIGLPERHTQKMAGAWFDEEDDEQSKPIASGLPASQIYPPVVTNAPKTIDLAAQAEIEFESRFAGRTREIEFLEISASTVLIPVPPTASEEVLVDQPQNTTSSTVEVPGRFRGSVYNEAQSVYREADPGRFSSTQSMKYSVNVENIKLKLSRSMIALMLSLPQMSRGKNQGRNTSNESSPSPFAMVLSVTTCQISLVDFDNPISLLELKMNAIRSESSSDTTESIQTISVRSLVLGYGVHGTDDDNLPGNGGLVPTKPILSFDIQPNLVSSMAASAVAPSQDIVLSFVKQSQGSVQIDVKTRALRLNLDMAKLEETFNSFGGLSSILDLNDSVTSTATVTKVTRVDPVAPSRLRGVHFSDSPQIASAATPSTANQTSVKVNCRTAGFSAALIGKACLCRIDGTAIKVIHRAQATAVAIDKFTMLGPLLHESENSDTQAAFVQARSLRVEYLQSALEDDLVRLLALLSPSNARDEDLEEEILLDTLIKQRKQGGVLRVQSDNIKLTIPDLQRLRLFESLVDELKAAASVTQYLPEDDRPGIMTLLRIQRSVVEIRINEHFEDVQAAVNHIECAHVALPAMALVSMGSLELIDGDDTILGPIIPVQKTQAIAVERSPMVTLKWIGDEMDPTLRFRFSKLRADYYPRTILKLLRLPIEGAENVLADLSESILETFSETRSPSDGSPPILNRSSSSNLSSRRMQINVAIKECAVALHARESPAQALIVLHKIDVKGALPSTRNPDLWSKISLEKASILIVDKTPDWSGPQQAEQGLSPATPVLALETLSSLRNYGYVSVCDLSSASLDIDITAGSATKNKTIDIVLRNQLLVIESCADSTKTLIGILGQLAPPLPPNRDLKYRTEVLPLENMLQSIYDDTAKLEQSVHTRPIPEEDADAAEDENDFMDPELFSSMMESTHSLAESQSESDLQPNVADLLTESQLLPMAASETTTIRDPPKLDVAPVLEFRDDHFKPGPADNSDTNAWNSAQARYDPISKSEIKSSPLRFRVDDIHVIWNLFDGYDWQQTRDKIAKAVDDVEQKALEKQLRRDKRRGIEPEDDDDSVIGDFLFNSIWVGVGPKQDPRELTKEINRQINDFESEADSYATSTTMARTSSQQSRLANKRKRRLRTERSRKKKMTIELKGISADILVYEPDSGETQSTVNVRVSDVEIFDHLTTSTWKKFLTYMKDKGERELGSSMLHAEVIYVKPSPDLAASEIVLKLRILPLRLHVDQDALDFISRFFEFKDDSEQSVAKESELPFLQRVEVLAVPIKLDFKPKRIDYAGLRSGRVNELKNVFVLEDAEMVLRRIIVYGVLGFEKLGTMLNDIWTADVKTNQLPQVLSGLAPARNFVNLGYGVRNLLVVPLREYEKDRRVLRALSKGAVAFAKSTTTELAKLGAKVALGTQTVLSNAEGLLVPADNEFEVLDESEIEEKLKTSPYAESPLGVMSGIRYGMKQLERDLYVARDAIVAIPGEVMESGNAKGAAAAVLRNAPTVILRPALGVTKVVGHTLMGAVGSLDPAEKRRREDKYKRY